MKFSLLATLALAGAALASPVDKGYPNRIIFIRHAEKGCATLPGDDTCGDMPRRPPGREWPGHPPPGGPGKAPRKFPNGLSNKGKERAEYLRTLFGPASDYDFGHIFAAPRDEEFKDGERTFATVAPLADELGLEVDIHCANEPAACVAEAVQEFAKSSDKDILVCWKHRELHVIATALGAPNAQIHYPDERNDVIWIMQDGEIREKTSMHMPGLDDGRIDEGDPDLEVEPAPSVTGWLYRLIALVV